MAVGLARALTGTKIKSRGVAQWDPTCPRCGAQLMSKGALGRGADGLRLCHTCRRNPDPVWLAVYTGEMTFEEAIEKWPYVEEEEEEAS